MSPPPEDLPAERNEFSPEERALLLKLAHEAIASALEGREIGVPVSSRHLQEGRGVFTTLYHRGSLRGCVGQMATGGPLQGVVVETARSAAFADTRFPPVRQEELPEIKISLSVLSPLEPIRAEQVEIGRHGLLIRLGNRRGLLLPQVPVEHGWDRVTFLQQTCLKAGLGANDWRAGAEILAFTAEVFGDESAR